jgi:hypothetical protein
MNAALLVIIAFLVLAVGLALRARRGRDMTSSSGPPAAAGSGRSSSSS